MAHNPLPKKYSHVAGNPTLPSPKSHLLPRDNFCGTLCLFAIFLHLCHPFFQVCGGETPYMNQGDLEQYHDEHRQSCLTQFVETRKMGGDEYSRQFLDRLDAEVQVGRPFVTLLLSEWEIGCAFLDLSGLPLLIRGESRGANSLPLQDSDSSSVESKCPSEDSHFFVEILWRGERGRTPPPPLRDSDSSPVEVKIPFGRFKFFRRGSGFSPRFARRL